MEYRTFGGTGIQVSRYCLGAMMFGAMGNTDHAECIRITHAALDAGINFIDTADGYSRGESEEILAKALSGRRNDVILATKCFFPTAIADLDALGERSLWVDCDVIQADGGTRCASITGAYVALALGVERMRARGDLAANPLRDSVAAVSAGVVSGDVVLDLPYEEDSRAAVDMNVIATGSGRFVEIQGTGEEATFSRTELNSLTELALGGIAALTLEQQGALSAAASAPQ